MSPSSSSSAAKTQKATVSGSLQKNEGVEKQISRDPGILSNHEEWGGG